MHRCCCKVTCVCRCEHCSLSSCASLRRLNSLFIRKIVIVKLLFRWFRTKMAHFSVALHSIPHIVFAILFPRIDRWNTTAPKPINKYATVFYVMLLLLVLLLCCLGSLFELFLLFSIFSSFFFMRVRLFRGTLCNFWKFGGIKIKQMQSRNCHWLMHLT